MIGMLIIDCKAHIKVYRTSCMTRIHTVALIKIWDNIVSFYLLDYFKLFFVSKLRAGTSKLSHENFTCQKRLSPDHSRQTVKINVYKFTKDFKLH